MLAKACVSKTGSAGCKVLSTIGLRFRESAAKCLRRFQMWDLHSRLPALQLASDYAIISDGITPGIGVPLHVHLAIVEGRCGQLQWHLIGIQPVVAVANEVGARLSCEEPATAFVRADNRALCRGGGPCASDRCESASGIGAEIQHLLRSCPPYSGRGGLADTETESRVVCHRLGDEAEILTGRQASASTN